MITPWQSAIEMIRSAPTRRNVQGQIHFKATTPNDVVRYMRENPAANTVPTIMAGMHIKRSTTKRLMGTLVDDGQVSVDKDAHPKHFIYRLTAKD